MKFNTIAALYHHSAMYNNVNTERDFANLYDSKEEARMYTVAEATMNTSLTTRIGKSTVYKDVEIVDGGYKTMAIIPVTVQEQQYFEVVVGEDKVQRYKHREKQKLYGLGFPVNNPLVYNAICPATQPVQKPYYHGIALSFEDMYKLYQYVVCDGKIYKLLSNGYKEVTQTSVYKYKGSSYNKRHVYVKIGDTCSHKAHQIIYCASRNKTLDSAELMTRNMIDVITHGINDDDNNSVEYRQIQALRWQGWKWSLDHIDNNTSNNYVENLQMITTHANTVLRVLRKNDFKMIIHSMETEAGVIYAV